MFLNRQFGMGLRLRSRTRAIPISLIVSKFGPSATPSAIAALQSLFRPQRIRRIRHRRLQRVKYNRQQSNNQHR